LTRNETGQTPAPAAIESAPTLLAYALALELEASERYADLADQMETHNSPEVAELFQKLSHIEKLHADHVLEQAAALSLDLPAIAASAYQWEDPEGPETTDFGDAHYLMTAHRALQLALHNEQRAFEFFTGIAAKATDQDVVKLAEEMAEEEREHVALMEDWLAKYPPTDEAWSDDPDPPVVQG
jgi:rubrerythrin